MPSPPKYVWPVPETDITLLEEESYSHTEASWEVQMMQGQMLASLFDGLFVLMVSKFSPVCLYRLRVVEQLMDEVLVEVSI